MGVAARRARGAASAADTALEQQYIAIAGLVTLIWLASVGIGFRHSLATLALLGYAAAIVGLWRPRLGIVGVGVLATIDPTVRVYFLTGGLLRWNSLSYWLLIVALLSISRLSRLRDAQTLLLVAFGLALLAGLAITPDLRDGVDQMILFLSIFGFTAYFAVVATDPRTWYWLGVICGITGAGAGLAFYREPALLPTINPNAWSHVPLTALFAICLGYPAARERPLGQPLLAALGFVNAVWVFLSSSRGNFLLAAICGIYLIVATRGIGRRGTIVGVSAMIGLWTLARFGDLQNHMYDRLRESVDPRISVRSRTSGRSELLAGGLHMFATHPLGVGTGGFGASWSLPGGGREVAPAYHTTLEVMSHAAWIKILAENGIIGFPLFVLYVLSIGVSGWRSDDPDRRRIGVLTTVLLVAAFTSTEFQSRGLWFLAAGATAFLRREQLWSAVLAAQSRARRRSIAGRLTPTGG
jgi:hypothetical protein